MKSYYPRFAHVKESCKACFRKAVKLHTYKNTLKLVFGKPFCTSFLENIFENSFLGYSKSNFQKESLGG